LFFIEPVVDHKTKEVTGFKVYGGGWGHGVGLSQTGAMGMAVKGIRMMKFSNNIIKASS
jgi:stage II sporulation protein D